MSVPQTLFLDTSVFDGFKFNFESATVRTFMEAVEGGEFSLLIPEPTYQEIIRHIDEHSDRAAKAISGAGKKEPFLRKLAEWPLRSRNEDALKHEMKQVAMAEFTAFLREFKVERLGYDGVEVSQVMEWYHAKAPPFSEGKKSEFPDAVALASLLDYQRKLKAPIAVISHDPDFKKACERYSELYYFQSLAAFTEITKSADERIELIRNALIAKEEEIWKEIERLFSEAGFVLSDHWDADMQDPEIVSKDDVDYHVVSLGESVCTVAFEAEIEFSVQASYDDMDNAVWDGGEAFPFDTIERSCEETARISGTLKLRITSDGASIIEVTHTSLDQRDFTISSEYRDY